MNPGMREESTASNTYLITSEGDLEVTFLYESHTLLADLISQNYYSLLGTPPCEVRFPNESIFWAFYVHVEEFLVEARNSVKLDGKPVPLSLLGAAERFCTRYREEAESTGLADACTAIRNWTDTQQPFSFWCGEIGAQIKIPLNRRRLIWYGANLSKHSLLRITKVMENLQDCCNESGVRLRGLDLAHLREPFVEELRSRLLYLSTWLVELLGTFFLALNEIVSKRYRLVATNDIKLMKLPEGITSDAIRNLYGQTLVFQSYTRDRITRYLPATPPTLKQRY